MPELDALEATLRTYAAAAEASIPAVPLDRYRHRPRVAGRNGRPGRHPRRAWALPAVAASVALLLLGLAIVSLVGGAESGQDERLRVEAPTMPTTPGTVGPGPATPGSTVATPGPEGDGAGGGPAPSPTVPPPTTPTGPGPVPAGAPVDPTTGERGAIGSLPLAPPKPAGDDLLPELILPPGLSHLDLARVRTAEGHRIAAKAHNGQIWIATITTENRPMDGDAHWAAAQAKYDEVVRVLGGPDQPPGVLPPPAPMRVRTTNGFEWVADQTGMFIDIAGGNGDLTVHVATMFMPAFMGEPTYSEDRVRELVSQISIGAWRPALTFPGVWPTRAPADWCAGVQEVNHILNQLDGGPHGPFVGLNLDRAVGLRAFVTPIVASAPAAVVTQLQRVLAAYEGDQPDAIVATWDLVRAATAAGCPEKPSP